MTYLGDFALGATFDFKFTSRAFASGAPTTLSGSPVVSAYVDNNTTELTAGITLTVDFDSRTGMNNVRVVASSGNGYAAGGNYSLVITTGTVGGVSVVGEVVGMFSIEARSALRPTTAGRTLVVDAAGLADANTVKVGPTGAGTAQTARDIGASVLLSSGTGTGQLDFTSGVVKSNLVQILATALTETAGLLAAGFKKFFNVATPTGTLNSIPDAVAGASGGLLIAGSNAATTVNITGNLTGNVTGSVGSVSGAVGSVTGSVGGNVTGSVGSVASGGIAAASFAANAIDASALATSAVTEIQTGLATSTALATAQTTLTKLDGMLQGDSGSGNLYQFTVKALEEAPTGGSTPAQIADAVWDEALSGHTTPGSAGAALTAAGSAGDPWSTLLPGAYGAGTAGKIVGDNLTGNAYTRLGAPAGASVSADIAAVKTQTAAIETDTQDIQGRLPAALISGRIDATVGAMQTDVLTSTALAASAVTEIQSGLATTANVAAVETDTQDIQSRLPAALVSGRMDSSVGAVAAGVDFSATMKASINAEVVDGLSVDTYAEPGQGAPAATASIAAKLGYLYKGWRNKVDQTATQYSLYADDASTVDQKASVSDNGTTFTRGEVVTGP